MIRQHRWLLPLLFLFILAFAAPAHAQTKQFYWDGYDVLIELQPNGDLHVVETQSLAFSGGTFTFGYVVLEKNNLEAITDIRVREPDRVYTKDNSNDPYTFTVDESRREIRIDWYFPPTTGSNTYIFEYTVKGAIKVEENGNQLRWIALRDELISDVYDAAVTVQAPSGVTFLAAEAWRNNASYPAGVVGISDDGRTAEFGVDYLPRGVPFEVGVRFPVEQMDLAVPGWQRAEGLQDLFGLILLGVGLILLFGVPLVVFAYWRSRGRDPDVGVVPDYLSEPPSALPPAVAGTLVDERADMRDIISTLIDLAERGYVEFTELKNDFNYKLTDKSRSDLAAFERELIRAVFGRKQSVDLDDLKYKFASKLPGLRETLYDEIVERGLAPSSPQKVRNRYRAITVGIAMLGAVAFFGAIALSETIPTAICPVFALIPGLLAMAYTSSHMPTKTEAGALEAAKWDAFRKYLKDTERYGSLDEAKDRFAAYLPYAVAFGLERSWIRKFAQLETVPSPPWYHPYPRPMRPYGRSRRIGGGTLVGGGATPGVGDSIGGGMPSLEGMSGSLTTSLNNMSDGLTRMLNSSATVFKSTPPSSSSSGGFSGGGFSGGFSGGSSGGGGGGFG